MGIAELAALASRWLHLVGAIIAVGGAIFILLVVLPASRVLSAEAREAFHTAARRQWSKVVIAAITILLATGLYNFFTINGNFRGELPRWYHPLFGVKFILAMAIFAIASLLAGRTPLAQKMRTKMKFWLSLNLVLAALVIAISTVLRTAHPPVPRAAEPERAVAQADQASSNERQGQIETGQIETGQR